MDARLIAPTVLVRALRACLQCTCFAFAGITYGLGTERLADNLRLSIPAAHALRKGFLDSFPTLAQFANHLKRLAKTHHAIPTIAGRKRPLPNINSANSSERAKAERQAVNTAVQGSAADIIKEAMIRCTAALAQRRVRARLVASIHDELVYEVDENELHVAAAIVRRHMEHLEIDGMQLPLLPVDIVSGRSWGEMAPIAEAQPQANA